jgi:hypothetical protein
VSQTQATPIAEHLSYTTPIMADLLADLLADLSADFSADRGLA